MYGLKNITYDTLNGAESYKCIIWELRCLRLYEGNHEITMLLYH